MRNFSLAWESLLESLGKQALNLKKKKKGFKLKPANMIMHYAESTLACIFMKTRLQILISKQYKAISYIYLRYKLDFNSVSLVFRKSQ